MDDVAAQGQRQALVFAAPPHTKVLAHVQPLVPVCELALVDDQPDLSPAGAHCGKDLVEGHYEEVELLRGLA